MKYSEILMGAAGALVLSKVSDMKQIRLRERVMNAISGRGFKPDSETDLMVLAQMEQSAKESLEAARKKAPEKKAGA